MPNLSNNSRHKDFMLQQGPHYEVRVGFDHENYPQLGAEKLNVKVSALVDTGSELNCIDKQLAGILDLPVVSVKPMQVMGVGGSFTATVHLAQVYIPALDYTVIGRFVATHLNSVGQNHAIILGRQFLQDFKMVYDGNSGDFILVRNDLSQGDSAQYKRFNDYLIDISQTYPFLDLTKYIIPLDKNGEDDDDNSNSNGHRPELNLAVVSKVA